MRTYVDGRDRGKSVVVPAEDFTYRKVATRRPLQVFVEPDAGKPAALRSEQAPFSEQREIISFLDERCSAIDEVVAHQEQPIDKLGELRKPIIHHAVTGKIDCPEG